MITQNELPIWSENYANDENYILGDDTDTLGNEADDAITFVNLLGYDPYKTILLTANVTDITLPVADTVNITVETKAQKVGV